MIDQRPPDLDHEAFQSTPAMERFLREVDGWELANRTWATSAMLSTLIWIHPNVERAQLVINAAPQEQTFENFCGLLLEDKHLPYLKMLLERRSHMDDPAPSLVNVMQDAIIHNRLGAAQLLLSLGQLDDRMDTWCAATCYNQGISHDMVDLMYHHPTVHKIIDQQKSSELNMVMPKHFSYVLSCYDAHERKIELAGQVEHAGVVRGARKL